MINALARFHERSGTIVQFRQCRAHLLVLYTTSLHLLLARRRFSTIIAWPRMAGIADCGLPIFDIKAENRLLKTNSFFPTSAGWRRAKLCDRAISRKPVLLKLPGILHRAAAGSADSLEV